MADPAKEIDLLITEMEEGLKKAKEEVVSQTAQAKRAQTRCDDLEREAAQWERRAMQALQGGDEDLAKEALNRKLEKEGELSAARQIHQEQLAYADQLKGSLKELEARLKEVKGRKETLKARAKAAKEGGGGIQGGKAFEEFSRLENQIEAFEEIQGAAADLSGRDAATEAKFARLEGGNPEVEDALAALKRKMDAGQGEPEGQG